MIFRTDITDQFFVFHVPDAVEQQREDDGQRKADRDIVQGKGHRIADDGPGIIRFEEFDELVEPHPFAAPNAVPDGELPEGDLNAYHRPIAKNDQKES